MKLELIQEDGGEGDGKVVLERFPALIGRGWEALLRLPNPEVSRHHCEIGRMEAHLIVRDLGSTNGTYVNGLRVTEALLMPGDKLSLGGAKFRVQYKPAPAQWSVVSLRQLWTEGGRTCLHHSTRSVK